MVMLLMMPSDDPSGRLQLYAATMYWNMSCCLHGCTWSSNISPQQLAVQWVFVLQEQNNEQETKTLETKGILCNDVQG